MPRHARHVRALAHRFLLVLVVTAMALPALPTRSARAQDVTPADAQAVLDTVVGDGTAASCDGNALEAAVVAGGAVTFACGSAPVTILANTMVLDGVSTVINGGGNVTIDGEGARQLFIVNAGANLALQDITLRGGRWGGGGGAIDNAGTLLIERSTLQDNTAESGGNGGAILQRGGTLTMRQSTLQSNAATGGGSGGAIAVTGGTVHIRQSTFNGNFASLYGGAFYLEGGDFTLENSTVSANQATSIGGGLFSNIPEGAGAVALLHDTFYLNTDDGAAGNLGATQNVAPIQLRNSILYATGAPNNCYLNRLADLVSGDYNLANDDSCGLSGVHDVQNVDDPLLGQLADNGGPTFTHAPQVGSAAVDTIPATACGLTDDQRGFPRPQGTGCDKGAVDSVPTEMPPLPINQPAVAPFYLGKLFVRPFNLPIFTTATNVVAQRLEVTQGIQAAAGTGVTLVAGKRTYVRFHVRRDLGSTDPVVGARLWRIVNGQRVGDPLFPSGAIGFARFVPFYFGGSTFVSDPYITVRSNPNRNTLNDSFYFRLPNAWTAAGDLTIEAEANPAGIANRVLESTYADNSSRATVTFNSTPIMYLRLYAVSYKKNGTVYTPTEVQLREAEDWLRRAYPIARLVVKRDALDMTDLGFEPDCTRVNGRLIWASIFLRWGGIDPQPTRYYGMVSDGGTSANFMRGCADNIPSFVASGPTGDTSTVNIAAWDIGNDGTSYGDWYMGHELGHTWGRRHVNCAGTEVGTDAAFPLQNGTIGRKSNADAYWGFDISLKGPVVYPPTWTEIMTYCSNQWISNYTYEAIRNRLVSENSAAELQAAAMTAPADYLIIEGAISPDESNVTLRQIFRITAPGLLPPPTPGGWEIRLLDNGGTLLATYPFTPRIDTDDSSEQNDALIMEQVLWVTGTRLIQVRKGGNVLASRPVSANAPVVTVTAPVDGEVVDSGGLLVTWNATDADGDPLTATVLYSRDGGANFAPLVDNVKGTSVTIPANQLGYTTQGKVRVIVSDGVLTGQADSQGFFTAPNQPPRVQILTPAADSTVAYGPALNLTAAATDFEDGALPESAFRWSSNVDGPLGTGPAFDVLLQSISTHTITLEVVDSNGGIGRATRVVVVNNDTSVTVASLNATPASTSAVLPLGGETTQPFSLRNPSGAVLTWQATSNAPWLTLDALQGQTPADPVLRISTTGLGVGVHEGVITINTTAMEMAADAVDTQAPQGELATQQVRVFLTVAGNTTLLPIVKQ
jgi:hypothetical protein